MHDLDRQVRAIFKNTLQNLCKINNSARADGLNISCVNIRFVDFPRCARIPTPGGTTRAQMDVQKLSHDLRKALKSQPPRCQNNLGIQIYKNVILRSVIFQQ